MSKDKRPATAALRLQNLSGLLKRAYQNAGDHIADALMPIEEAVAEIDEPWMPTQFAEALKSDAPDKAHRPQSCFATETFANGDKADYVLCVGRKHDRRCGLHVSYCQYAAEPAQNTAAGNRPKVAIRESLVILPDKLAVPMRLKILDILDAFSEGYEAHVRKVRGEILDRFATDSPLEEAALPPTDAETPPPEPTVSDVPKSDETTAPEKAHVLRLDNVNENSVEAPPETAEDDATILEETQRFDEDEILKDIADPLDNGVPDEPPVEEAVHESPAPVPENKPLAVPPPSERENKRMAANTERRPRPHAVVSARLEEAEAKIPLKAWI